MNTQRTQLLQAVQALPDESIGELVNFISYLQYKTSHDRTILSPDKIYEVWTPIEAPEASQVLMALLEAEKALSNV